MRHFLRNSLLFAIPICLSFAIGEYLIRTLPNEYTTKISHFEERVGQIEVLVLGSSHAQCGVNPHLFIHSRCYNLAMVSQPLQIDYKLFFAYQQRLENLKYLVISISYFSLSKQLSEGEIKRRLPYYKHFYHLNMDDMVDKTPAYFSAQVAVGFKVAAQRILRYFLRSGDVNTDSLGWMGFDTRVLNQENEFANDAQLAASRHEDHSLDFQDNLKLIGDIIDYCRSNQIEVILVDTPKTPWYVSNLDPTKRQRIRQAIEGLQSTMGVRYLDFETDSRFNLSDFMNSDHLNERGAAKLSSIIEAYIDNKGSEN